VEFWPAGCGGLGDLLLIGCQAQTNRKVPGTDEGKGARHQPKEKCQAPPINPANSQCNKKRVLFLNVECSYLSIILKEERKIQCRESLEFGILELCIM
jgi:hypothetical protein